MEDTIAAISTAIGEGGIAIIRVSGPQALDLADRIFFSKRGKPSQFLTHTIHFGTIGSDGDLIDQVMLSVMRAPRTYTGEDTVEVNCHGGVVTAKEILARCLQNGARLAEPGEFTKRAFLNGRLDLAQAEAVMDVISAKTTRAQAAAEQALEGRLSREIEQARERLLTLIAHIEAHIDFPDEGIDAGTQNGWTEDASGVSRCLAKLLGTAHDGKVLRHGITVAIVGRPNAGKSSLMNALLREDRSIVTRTPGTTRDTVEEMVSINGIPVVLTDTAGLRKARGSVENEGIKRSRKSIQQSDLVLHVLDGSRPFSDDDQVVAELCSTKVWLVVINKTDLKQRLVLPDEFRGGRGVAVSALRGDGLNELRDEIEAFAWSGGNRADDLSVAINERQAEAIRRAVDALEVAVGDLKRGEATEIISQMLRVGLNALGEVVGKTSTEDILERIFSTFCIGK